MKGSDDDDGLSVERLLTLAVVAELIGFSRVHLMHLSEAGKFPRPIKLGTRRIAFKQSEVSAWIANRERAWKTPGVAA
jgi:prophage regulatory protein